MARSCREAGARVKENQLLRDLNIVAQADDQRKIEVIANGLPFWGGKQVAIDTVVSALTGWDVVPAFHRSSSIIRAFSRLTLILSFWRMPTTNRRHRRVVGED